ncbi:hypothetical protein FB451DRAFT_1178177 [Mycena latifolia]|nr:hypothetical protein FB451DRAFT_1178177 [Mycena latifolia]
MILLPLPSDALRNPEKWDADWEAFLRMEFARRGKGPVTCVNFKVKDFKTTPRLVDEALDNYQTLVSQICALQRTVTEEALHHFKLNNLDGRWMAASPDERRKHILGTMVAVCSKALNLNDARAYCAPELRPSRLRLNGKVFLDLLKSAMLDDASFIPTTPTYISHPERDAFAAAPERLNDTENMKIAFARILLLRTKLICKYSKPVQFGRANAKTRPRTPVYPQKIHKPVQNPIIHTRQPEPELVAALGRDAAKAFKKDVIDGHKARRSERVACQSADWKLRHHTACGKALDFDTASQPIVHPTSVRNSDQRIPLPVDGYKRSLALADQVTELNLAPTIDYRLYTDSGAVLRVDFGAGPCIQAPFRRHREVAMTTGDRDSIAKMAHFLCAAMMTTDTASHGVGLITSTMIVEQLAREFVFDDLREAVLEMQELQNRDPERRPPLLAAASPAAWADIVEVTNYPDIVVTFD